MQRVRSNDIPGLPKIEYVFYNERQIRSAVTELKNAGKVSNETGRRSVNKFSDPTGSAAVKNLTPLKMILLNEKILYNPEQWLEVVDRTLNFCRRRGDIFLNVFRGRYSGEHFAKTCAKSEIGVDTFYRVLEKIRYHAALVAASLQLIFIE